MNLLVGATGFVGGHLVEYLFQQGEISKGVFRKGSHLKIMDANGVQGLEADLLDHHSLHEAMEGVDVVYNLASPMPGADSGFEQVNAQGVLNLLETANEAGTKAFIHLSTLDIFGKGRVDQASTPRPSNAYQRSKAEAERILLEFSKRTSTPRVAIIRPAKAVGSRDGSLVIPILRMISAGKVTVPSSGLMSYTHPKDIAQAMFKAAGTAAPTGASYLVKSFDSTVEDIARGIVKETGAGAEVKKRGLLGSGRLPGYTDEQIRASITVERQDSWSEIGYEPRFSLESTCEEIAGWYRKEPWAVDE